jgi:hypothetical protein
MKYEDCALHTRVALAAKVLPLQTGTITGTADPHPTAGPRVEVTWDKGNVQAVTVRSLLAEEDWEAHELSLHAKSVPLATSPNTTLPPRENKLERRIVDYLRSAMYGTDPLLQEVEEIAELLSDLDGVAYNPDTNRLTQALEEVRKKPSLWKKIDHLNDDEE